MTRENAPKTAATTPAAYKATSPLGFGYGETAKEAIDILLKHNPSEKRERVAVRGRTDVKKNGKIVRYRYDREISL